MRDFSVGLLPQQHVLPMAQFLITLELVWVRAPPAIASGGGASAGRGAWHLAAAKGRAAPRPRGTKGLWSTHAY